MWNSRFFAGSQNPFDNSGGFSFPAPEGGTLSYLPHLLTAQAFIPPTERVEMAGFAFPGDNAAIRAEVARRLNATPAYRELFGSIFAEVKNGGAITFDHFGAAVAEFTFSLDFADAPIDQYARGNRNALTPAQKRGAVLFFGTAGCIDCHATKGPSNEMFSDFQQHVIGVPQIAPLVGNVTFDGPGQDEDFGLEQVTGNAADRYAFRSSPLRNIGLQTTFMHNGAFTRLEDAIRHHLTPFKSARKYDPVKAGVAPDLRVRRGPIEPVLAKLDPKLKPKQLSDAEVQDLVAFVGQGLLDPDATPAKLRKLIPAKLPSGKKGHVFQ
jgi:cytochrome c peroxidase